MLTLINANRMLPPIAPVGLDYVAEAAAHAGIDVEVVDLCLADDPRRLLADHFAKGRPELVGVSFRNVDDCFYPGGTWFVPELESLVGTLRSLTDAPIVLGGVGLSIFAQTILDRTGADFAIRGDGEAATVALVRELRGSQRLDRIDGLLWRDNGTWHANRPAWPGKPTGGGLRRWVDNAVYFRRGGQIGVETKRGCNRHCLYCADPLAKGATIRPRPPESVAGEFESLVAQGIDVFHLCDSEFNIPIEHARAVCDALIGRGLGQRLRWYAYLAVVPLDADLIHRMRRAGCVGINFTSDAANSRMLAAYRQPHRPADLETAVRLCREHGIAVMTDLLLGGPGETPETAAESIAFFKRLDPDCAGAALGVRVYPQTGMEPFALGNGSTATPPGIHRRYSGPIDLLRPTFYVSPTLGGRPARLIRELIGGDPRFFEPADDADESPSDGPSSAYNYSANQPLTDAIAQGARGAYWDILRRGRERR